MIRFAVCNELFEGWDFRRVCEAASSLGYTGIEIAPFTLGRLANDVAAGQRSEMHAVAADNGLEIVGLHWLLAHTQGFHINHPDAEVRDRTARYLVDLAELCADLGGTVMVFGSPKQRSVSAGMSSEQAWSLAAETFGSVIACLERLGVTLCLEPLSPQETDFINTASQAAKMIRQIGSPTFQLLLDVKAMTSEPVPIPDIIRDSRSILRHFHANDANLRGPGFGDTDFVPIAAALKDIGYDGWVSVEVFDFSPDPVTVASRSLEYLKNAFVQE